jgi:Glycosyl transferase family 2
MTTLTTLDHEVVAFPADEPETPRTREPDISILIPAYNEEAGLAAVLDKVQRVIDDRYEVIVIDDGSDDATFEVASRFPFRVISHAKNAGKGAAMRTGMQAARAERVIFIDADDSYPVELIPHMAEKLIWSDLVFGERNNGRDNIPFFNRLGNRAIGGLLSLLYGFKGTDPLSGFYGLRKEHFQQMQIKSSGFAIEAEIALKSARMGLRIDGFPITYRERLGDSKLRAVQDGYRIGQTILRMLTLYSPSTVFVLPGVLIFSLASLMFGVLLATPLHVGGLLLETNTLLACGMLSLAGFQFATFGVALHLYGLLHKHTRPDRIGGLCLRFLTSPVSLVIGLTSVIVAGFVSFLSVVSWGRGNFGPYGDTDMLFLGAYLGIWGLQLLLAALFLSALADDVTAQPETGTVDRPAVASVISAA